MLKSENQIDAELARQRLFGEWLTVLGIAAWVFGFITVVHYMFVWAASCGR